MAKVLKNIWPSVQVFVEKPEIKRFEDVFTLVKPKLKLCTMVRVQGIWKFDFGCSLHLKHYAYITHMEKFRFTYNEGDTPLPCTAPCRGGLQSLQPRWEGCRRHCPIVGDTQTAWGMDWSLNTNILNIFTSLLIPKISRQNGITIELHYRSIFLYPVISISICLPLFHPWYWVAYSVWLYLQLAGSSGK